MIIKNTSVDDQPITSFYGPEKPEYEEMMSLMQPGSEDIQNV